MTIAPSGMSAGMPTTPGSSCAVAPPPLVGGGITPVQAPPQAAVPQATIGAGALGAPASAGLAMPGAGMPAGPIDPSATLGASTLGGAGTIAAAPSGSAPLFATPVTDPLAATLPLATTAIATAIGALGALAAPAAGATAPAAASPGVATPGPAGAPATAATPARLTTVAPGGSQTDANLVESTLNVLRQSPNGAALVDRLLAVGAKVNVISDDEFRTMGHGSAHAFYDPKIDTMFLRRSDLSDASKIRFAAVALAHEGTHLLDDVGKVSDPFIEQASARIAAAGGPQTAAGRSAQAQAMFELTMIKEARAFTFAGQVAKDLAVQTPASDPTSVASAGSNDQATYQRVWQALLTSSYNPDRLSAAPRNF